MFSFDFTLKFCLVWVMGLTFLFGEIKVTYHMSYHIGWRMKVFQISFCVMCVSDFWEQTVWCNGLDYSHLCGAVYFWWSKRSAFHLGQVRHCSAVLGSVHLSSFHIIRYLRFCMVLKSFQIAPIASSLIASIIMLMYILWWGKGNIAQQIAFNFLLEYM